MSKKHTINDCDILASNKSGYCVSIYYINNKEKIWWKCINGHIFSMRYNDVDQGHWCAFCYGNNKNTIKECHELTMNNEGKFLNNYYINAHTKYKWMCKNNHIFMSTYNDVDQGYWCPECFIS